MKAIDILMEEHRVIERVLDAVEGATYHLEQGHSVRAGFFQDAAEFFAGFADGTHHRKEEGVLFPAMIDAGIPAQGGPIPVMLMEHEQGRTLVRAMREAASRLELGEPEAAQRVVSSARSFVALLRDHIVKEDEVLFPMAAQLIPAAQHASLLASFEAAGADPDDTGERFIRLAERLTSDAAHV
jgi:hemerythrin-like domain-containing protein